MRNIAPQFTRKQVNKAGDVLLKERKTLDDYREYVNAFNIMSNWRASHNYPLNTFQANIRQKIRRAGYPNTIVVQRLKRVPSIISKLRREENMKLSTMQDIGGIRAILPTIKQVETIAESFRNSRFKHELVKEYNYIQCPKASGYRSIHYVYRYKNPLAPDYDGLRIELQIRNQLQHSWATAVEVVGAFLNTSLKSSEGPEKWLEFFEIVGSAFAIMEGCNPHENYSDITEKGLHERICHLEDSLSVERNLRAFGATIRAIKFNKLNFKYYLLHMKPMEKTVSFRGFHDHQLELATEEYSHIEKNIRDNDDEQVVLVSGVKFSDLQRAYPNYFLDTNSFLKNLNRLKKQLDNKTLYGIPRHSATQHPSPPR